MIVRKDPYGRIEVVGAQHYGDWIDSIVSAGANIVGMFTGSTAAAAQTAQLEMQARVAAATAAERTEKEKTKRYVILAVSGGALLLAAVVLKVARR